MNFTLLQKYLASDSSQFKVKSLHDFLHSISLLGFYRHLNPEPTPNLFLCYRFWNPHFRARCDIPEDMYKLPMPKGMSLRGKKRMLDIHTVFFLQRLAPILNTRLEVSQLDLARFRLHFALQQELDLLRNQSEEEIEFVHNEPEYTKNNEIAGYYGEVEIDSLREAFGNFFPIYQSLDVTPINQDMEVDDEPFDISTMPLFAKTEEDEVSAVYTSTQNDNQILDERFGFFEEIVKTEIKVEVEPPAAKKRRTTGSLSKKETEIALEFMYKEAKLLKSEE